MIADLGDLRAPTAGAKTGPPARIASSSVQTGPAARRSEAATNPDVTCRSLGMREHWPGGRQAAGGGCILWTAPAAGRRGWASGGGAGGGRRCFLGPPPRRGGGGGGRGGGVGCLGGRCRRSPRACWRRWRVPYWCGAADQPGLTRLSPTGGGGGGRRRGWAAGGGGGVWMGLDR